MARMISSCWCTTAFCCIRRNKGSGLEAKGFDPGELADGAKEEERVILQIALPETARFAAEAKEPLKTVPLHPCRSLAHAAGVKIEGGTHAEKERRIQLPPVLGHEIFLF